ncbi:MAG TPA: tetratricopeptide repeat protein [Solirubrobacteraceae bacterium]|jgi:serine/threonine-protein kinase PknG|nr:tetratricopeptide repeat protein [Solirubrobacteraceae bacterium]
MTACARSGCTGAIEAGFCDLCGLAPARDDGASNGGGPEQAEVATIGRPARSGGPEATPHVPTTQRWGGSARTRTTSRPRLGAGLVEVPPVPRHDPAKAVMIDPLVAEHRRFCGRCGSTVGRGRDGAPGRTEGFCRHCGAPFSFTPKLRAGDVVAEQYEVVGCIAHGGLGWIYLARDRNVADRWVVLKGLLNAADEEAMAAALAERLFLAEVEHPNIVKIINFVERDGSGYIVMEYVGGVSLKALLAARREANGHEPDPLPVAQSIAYVLEILPALGYLHRSGLLFCDLKLDNVIQTQDSLKLIDLGGVYRIGDTLSPVYGTAGYQAPEIEHAGPSIASDLFTVARTLAVLCIDFREFQTTHRHTLAPQHEVALFERYESLYQLLSKATAPNPDDRFQSAQEMADQLYGVLREVVADETGTPVPARSTLFTADFRGRQDAPDARLLPALRVATDDPAAGWLATLAAARPDEVVDALRRAPQRTIEVQLRLAQALIVAGAWVELEDLLGEIERRDPWEWRAQWYRGVAALAQELPLAARASFEIVLHAVPGELAPKLALGVCAELVDEHAVAAGWYDIVSRTDAVYSTATFGLARCRLACGDRAGALAAYERVPESASAHDQAQVARIRCLLSGTGDRKELIAAGAAIDDLDVGGEQRALLTAELLRAGLELVLRGGTDPDVTLAGHALEETALRLGLERTYRALAAVASSASERIRLVDEANRARPRTWR